MSASSADREPSLVRRWLRAGGVLWLGVFLWWFLSFDLPNGRLSDGTPLERGDVWVNVPDLLLENVFPTPNPEAPPSGWSYLPQRFDLLAVAGFIFAGAWGLGCLVLRGLRLRDGFDRPSRFVFAMGLGLSGLSLLTLGCGLAGLLWRPLLGGILAVCLIAEVACCLGERSPRSAAKQESWLQRRWRGLPIVCLAAVSPFVLAMLLGAMLPSIDFDVKEYHLEGPKEYFLQGRVTFLSHNVYTSFPFLTEMLSLLGMVLRDDWFRGALVGKVVLMTFAPLTAVGLFAAGRRWFHPTVGWLCVLLYLTTPWVYRISVIAYAEGGLTFYLFSTLLAVMWLMDEKAAKPHAAQLVLCGLLAGSAVACKYPGVLSVAIPVGGFLLIAAWLRRGGDAVAPAIPGASASRSAPATPSARSAPGLAAGQTRPPATLSSLTTSILRTTGWFTLGTLVTFGPWMAKNIAETGNPVYPLLYPVFGGADWDEASHLKWQQGHPPAIVELAKDPAAMFSNLGTRLVDVALHSDWQSGLLFGAAPFAFLWWSRRRLVAGLWLYVGWLFLSWWALTHQIDRFWVPLLPVVALLAGAGVGAMVGAGVDPFRGETPLRTRQIGLVLSGVTTLLIAAAVAFNLVICTTRLSGYNNYLIDLDFAREDPARKTASIALLDEVLPPESRVLFVGEAAVFDADFDSAYNTVFDESLFERWTSADLADVSAQDQPLRSADEIRRTLHEQGITHVFVNWSELLRYRTTYGYTEFVSPARFADLVQAGVLVQVPLDPQQALRLWEGLDEAARDVVRGWGDGLRVNVSGIEAIRQFELYRVEPPGTAAIKCDWPAGLAVDRRDRQGHQSFDSRSSHGTFQQCDRENSSKVHQSARDGHWPSGSAPPCSTSEDGGIGVYTLRQSRYIFSGDTMIGHLSLRSDGKVDRVCRRRRFASTPLPIGT